MENLKPPDEMDFLSTGATDVAEKWRKWKQTMELYIQLSLDSKSKKEKCSTFLCIIGQGGRNIYNAMTLQENEKNKIDILFRKFEEYCKTSLTNAIVSIREHEKNMNHSTSSLQN